VVGGGLGGGGGGWGWGRGEALEVQQKYCWAFIQLMLQQLITGRTAQNSDLKLLITNLSLYFHRPYLMSMKSTL